MPHTCPIKVCDLTVADKHLMCRTHWYMVPDALRTAVWRHYERFNAIRTDRSRLVDLKKAQQDAIDAVERQLEATMKPREEAAP